MAGSLTDARKRLIERSCRTIGRLYEPATLIAYRLAKPATGDDNNGSHSKYPRPHSPIIDTAFCELSECAQWLLDATTQLGLPRLNGMILVHSDASKAARWVAGNADTLAAEPDGAQWADDAEYHARKLCTICRIGRHDPTRWRGLLVVWNPTDIADTLTDLTGKPIRADRVRKTVSDGRVKPVAGKVILGEIASAMKL